MRGTTRVEGRMMRAGGEALSLLAAPLNVHILQTLEDEPKALLDLRRAVGSPPQSTMRLYSRNLTERGVIDRRRRAEFPGSAEYEITAAGRALLGVARVLDEWLQASPDGPIQLGTPSSKSATKALVEGWSTNVIRAIAARPLSLTELNRLIPKVSYPSLERRLGALRLASLVEPHQGDGRGTPYVATGWLRRAIVPLAAAAAWERRYRSEAAQPIGRLDVEAAFLLAVPLMEVPTDFEGKARLSVEIQSGSSPVFAGVLVCWEDGRVISCSSRLEGEAEAWVSGSPVAWLHRLSDVNGRSLEIGGDIALAEQILSSLGALATVSV